MKNKNVKILKQVDAHDRSQTTSLIVNPYKNDQIISIAHDGFIRTWNTSDMSISGTYRIISPYLMTIVPYDNGFLLGIGNGNLVRLNKQFQILKQYPLHQDCLTTILILQKYVVTGSYDGHLHFIHKQNYSILKTIDLNSPIYQCLFYEDNIYVASNPSYKISSQTFDKQQMGKFKQFITHKGKLFGCFDESGVTCINDKINTLVPCQFMLSLDDQVLICSERGIGVLSYDSNLEAEWYLTKITQFGEGMSILSGILYKGKIFLTGESGQIYKLKVSIQSQKINQKLQQNLVMISS